MKVIVARHCETDYNAQGRIQGLIDNALNATGRSQAARLAADVASYGIVRIVSSDLIRAVETAAYCAAATGAPATADRRLRECAFGSLDGASYAEFALRCGPRNLPTAAFVLKADFTPWGGEKGTDVFARQKALMDELKAAYDADVVMIVGHGRSLRTLLAPLGHPTSWLRTQGTHFVIDY